jgi:hypothetical protein
VRGEKKFKSSIVQEFKSSRVEEKRKEFNAESAATLRTLRSGREERPFRRGGQALQSQDKGKRGHPSFVRAGSEGGRYGANGAHLGCAFFIWGGETFALSGQGVGEVVGVFAVFDDDFHGALEAG